MNNLAKKCLTLDSREVAKMLTRHHYDLLKDIDRYSDYLGEGRISLSSF